MNGLLTWTREALTQNWGLKGLSLLLSVLIHVVVQRSTIREDVIEVSVSVVGVSKDRVFTGELPEMLRLHVRGRMSEIRDLRELLADRTRKVRADVSAYRTGERLVFDHRMVEQQLPSRHVEVMAVEPASLEVRLDTLDHRLVPVEAVLAGEPAAGMAVVPRSLRTEPTRVEVTGPQGELRLLKSIKTAPVDVTGADTDLRAVVRLVTPPAGHITLAVDEVTVTVALEEQPVGRVLSQQPVSIRGCPSGARCSIEPAEVTLRLEGSARAVSGFVAHPPDNLVFADLGPALQRGEREVPLRAHPIKGLQLTVEPGIAKFTVTHDGPMPESPAQPSTPPP
jgi:YbbR domain-containing protein